MRYHFKKLVVSLLLIQSSIILSLSPYYGVRSQGVNAARELAGWENFINLDNDCRAYGTFAGTLEYGQSFRPRAIASCLFGADIVNDVCTCDPAIVISGSQTTGRAPTDWLADYFGLPTDFKSTVAFHPLIQNFIIDLDMYIGLDNWLHGLYFRIDAPLTFTKRRMQLRETVQTAGVNSYLNGYFSAFNGTNAVASQQLVSNFTSFVTGVSTPQFAPFIISNTAIFPASVFDPLTQAKISLSPLERAGLAELRFALGWNWASECSHIGINARLAAPTGNKPTGEFVFEPIVGNGHHWEVGVGFTAHYDFWENCDGANHMGLYLDANITHLFKAQQRRTFDLKNKPNSRYMLAQRLGTTQLTPHLDNPPFPAIEFQSEFSPVANLTTFDVNVDIAVQGDVVLMLNLTRGRSSFDLGYNFWGTSCERVVKCGCPSPLDDGMTWALKGDASVIGFENLGPTTATIPVRLAATESAATIHAGTNFPATGTTDPTTITNASANPSIDSPMLATAGGGFPVLSSITAAGAIFIASGPQTHSSVPPVFLTLNDVDLTGIRGISNKLFAHWSYTWLERENWVPYLGVGGEVEFGNNNCSTNCSTLLRQGSGGQAACNSCVNCAVSQWGIWLKGGVAFN